MASAAHEVGPHVYLAGRQQFAPVGRHRGRHQSLPVAAHQHPLGLDEQVEIGVGRPARQPAGAAEKGRSGVRLQSLADRAVTVRGECGRHVADRERQTGMLEVARLQLARHRERGAVERGQFATGPPVDVEPAPKPREPFGWCGGSLDQPAESRREVEGAHLACEFERTVGGEAAFEAGTIEQVAGDGAAHDGAGAAVASVDGLELHADVSQGETRADPSAIDQQRRIIDGHWHPEPGGAAGHESREAPAAVGPAERMHHWAHHADRRDSWITCQQILERRAAGDPGLRDRQEAAVLRRQLGIDERDAPHHDALALDEARSLHADGQARDHFLEPRLNPPPHFLADAIRAERNRHHDRRRRQRQDPADERPEQGCEELHKTGAGDAGRDTWVGKVGGSQAGGQATDQIPRGAESPPFHQPARLAIVPWFQRISGGFQAAIDGRTDL